MGSYAKVLRTATTAMQTLATAVTAFAVWKAAVTVESMPARLVMMATTIRRMLVLIAALLRFAAMESCNEVRKSVMTGTQSKPMLAATIA